MGAVEPAGPFPDPDQVRRGVVPVPGQRVPAGHRFLEAQDEGLVAGPEVDLLERRFSAKVDATRPHEPQGPVDLPGQRVVVLPAGTARHELLVPGVYLGQIGEAALGEGTEQIEGRRGLVVGGDHAGRVRSAGCLRRGVVVDDVAAEAGQGPTVDQFGWRRARLGELTGDASQLDDGEAGAVGQHDGHLQNHLELVANAVRSEVVERLGAVPGLKQEGVPGGHLRQGSFQAASLAGEHQRGQA